MSWTVAGAVSGIVRDDAIAGCGGNVQCATDYSAFGGDRCIKLLTNTAAATYGRFAIESEGVGFAPAGKITVFQIAVGGGATTSNAVLINGPADCVRAHNSPRTIGIYDKSGTKWAESVSAWSTSALTTFYVMLDCVTDTNNVRVAIWNQYGVLESYQITGVAQGTFFNTSDMFFGDNSGSSRGADLFGACLARFSTTAADNPLWQRYPANIKVVGGGQLPPTAVGGLDEWDGTMTPDTGANKWKNLGATRDLASPTSHPGHDSDTSYCGVAATISSYGKRTVFTYSASNPVPTGANILWGELGMASKQTGAGKVVANLMIYDGTNQLVIATGQPSTSYTGSKVRFTTNAAAASLTKTDFDLSGGVSSGMQFGARGYTSGEAGGTSIGGRITALPGPVIVYHEGADWLQTFGSGY